MATKAQFSTVCPACGNRFVPGVDDIARHPTIHEFVHLRCGNHGFSRPFKNEWVKVSHLKGPELRSYATARGVETRDGNKWAEDMDLRYRICSLQDTDSDFRDASPPPPQAAQVDKTALEIIDTRELVLDILSKLDKPLSALVDTKFEDSASAIRELIKGAVSSIEDRVRDAIAKTITVKHSVVINKKETKVDGQVHRCFDLLLRMVAAGEQVWMAGPAGSGKTTAAHQVAKSLGLKFYFNGAIDSEYKLSGFIDAQGRVVSTAFREAYTNGGLYLFDEVDASMPSAVLAFNAALAGDVADFPGVPQPTPRHPKFRCIAAANTWGYGGGTEYVGRSKMDAAFLDRFIQLSWPYDEDLEAKMAGGARDWVDTVQEYRRRAAARGLKIVISPRATVKGANLLSVGFTKSEVLEATIFAKLSPESRRALDSNF